MKQLNDSDPSTTSPLMEGTPTIKSRKKLLQIIDTTLLKCYLHVRPRLSFFSLFMEDVHGEAATSEQYLLLGIDPVFKSKYRICVQTQS